ncbi:MAG: helix-turn-helix transcriptional regulator [Anaerotignum sp.]|nr:helix-turn-helix transcriptional regulator [Anaerotignum sp.]MBR5121930.1 helix-turn-helix transcriptional regulator [Anaerotignum sp.]
MGQKVFDARAKAGISQTQLAEKVGVTNQFICQIEAGKRGVSVETLKKLSDALGISFF